MATTGNFQKLINFNLIMAALHAIQGLLILVLSTDFSLPVITSYQIYDSLSQSLVLDSRELFSINLAYLVAAFFFMSATAHLLVSTAGKDWYVKNLKKGMNKARWFEYALSASTMMIGIAMLAGVEEFSLLLLIFGATAVMNLMGLVMEVHNQTTRQTNWLSYWIGCLAGALPWLVVGLYLLGSESSGVGSVPDFVFWIFISLFLFFNCFAINMVLQYTKVGKWSDYLYGERAYIILSLVAKSALAWQVFAGTLRPM